MISEIDIRDWAGTRYEVIPNKRLYEIPRDSWVLFNGEEQPTFFYNVDGMYSVCEDAEGLFHPAAWSVVSWFKPYAPKSN